MRAQAVYPKLALLVKEWEDEIQAVVAEADRDEAELKQKYYSKIENLRQRYTGRVLMIFCSVGPFPPLKGSDTGVSG